MALVRKEETLRVSHVNSAIILAVLMSSLEQNKIRPLEGAWRLKTQNSSFNNIDVFMSCLEAFVNETCKLLDLFIFQILVTDIENLSQKTTVI